MTFPIRAPVPAVGLSTILRPNGHNAYEAMRSDAKPNGMVMMSKKLMSAESTYPTAIQRAPNPSQMAFRIRRISPPAVMPAYRVTDNGGARQASSRVGSDLNIAACAGGTLLALPILVIRQTSR